MGKGQVRVTGTLSRPLKTGRLDIDLLLSEAANLVWDEYTAQVPVDKGDLRRSVRKTKINDGYRIAPTLTRYIYLHEGTGKYRGSSFDFGRRGGGRMREARYTEDEIAMFASIAKRGGTISVPPDKFADRTYRASKPRVESHVNKGISNEFNRYVRL